MVEPFQLPASIPGCDCVLCARTGIIGPIEEPLMLFTTYKIVKVNENGSETELKGAELDAFEQSYPKQADWLVPVKQTEWWKMCTKMVKHLLRDKDAVPFRTPVDPVLLQIPDYPKIIRHPMDLGTIDSKLNAEVCQYTHPNQVINDVRTVFRNCYIYNSNKTQVWLMAEALSRKFEQQVASYATVPPSRLAEV